MHFFIQLRILKSSGNPSARCADYKYKHKRGLMAALFLRPDAAKEDYIMSIPTNPLRISMQHFAEGGDPPAATPPASPPAGDDGKTYTADYVKALREEAKGHRLKATGYEKSLRTALSLKDDEEIGDLAQRLTAREASVLKAANDRLIAAELKTLDGYDHKLLAKVIDLSNVKVDDKGDVTGIKEAVEAAEKEYPAVKAAGARQPFVPPNPGATGGAETNPNAAMNALIRGKR